MEKLISTEHGMNTALVLETSAKTSGSVQIHQVLIFITYAPEYRF